MSPRNTLFCFVLLWIQFFFKGPGRKRALRDINREDFYIFSRKENSTRSVLFWLETVTQMPAPFFLISLTVTKSKIIFPQWFSKVQHENEMRWLPNSTKIFYGMVDFKWHTNARMVNREPMQFLNPNLNYLYSAVLLLLVVVYRDIGAVQKKGKSIFYM